MDSPLDQIRIIHATDRFVVIDKPAGVLSVPGKAAENKACAASWVRERFPAATGPVTVHRLDMDTSGLLVCALDEGTQRELSRQFEAREIEKEYLALVEGRVEAESGVLDAPMRLDPENRPFQIVDREQGRAAQTAFRVLAFEPGCTRLSLTPRTGRTHQLRVHCAHKGEGGLGHPILGDILYGDETSAPRLMLHAWRLVLTDPGTGRRLNLEAPAPF